MAIPRLLHRLAARFERLAERLLLLDIGVLLGQLLAVLLILPFAMLLGLGRATRWLYRRRSRKVPRPLRR
ncbi:hypothetical protein [Modicisalibacter coralii]|uniref:hypothetical protein n=1 Tax=Modicisalibacter coralii TaxID=2304602 RepID=UPI00100B4404|nr:hypothetical protein [Halomonas coralii]